MPDLQEADCQPTAAKECGWASAAGPSPGLQGWECSRTAHRHARLPRSYLHPTPRPAPRGSPHTDRGKSARARARVRGKPVVRSEICPRAEKARRGGKRFNRIHGRAHSSCLGSPGIVQEKRGICQSKHPQVDSTGAMPAPSNSGIKETHLVRSREGAEDGVPKPPAGSTGGARILLATYRSGSRERSRSR